MTVSELKTYLPSTYPIIEKQLKRAHLICIVACSVIKYTGKVFYDYSRQKTQLIPGVLIGIRAGFYFSATLSLPLTIIAGAISLIAYSLLISTARTLRNFQFHKEGWKKEFDPYQDPFIKMLQSEETLKAQREALKKSLRENQEKYVHQLQLAQTLPEENGVLDVSNYKDYQTLIDEFNRAINSLNSDQLRNQKISLENPPALTEAKNRLIFWILLNMRFNISYTLSKHLLSYKELGGLLPESILPLKETEERQKTFLLKEIDTEVFTRFEDELNYKMFLQIFTEQPIYRHLKLSFFTAQAPFNIHTAPIDPSINYIDLLKKYYDTLSTDTNSFNSTALSTQDKEDLERRLFGTNGSLDRIKRRIRDISAPTESEPEALELYYSDQEKKLLIILTYIEKKKEEIKKIYGLCDLPLYHDDPAFQTHPDLKKEVEMIIGQQSTFITELARQSAYCSTATQSCIESRFSMLGPFIFNISEVNSGLGPYLGKLVGEFRKDRADELVESSIRELTAQGRMGPGLEVHSVRKFKSALSLFFRFPFEANLMESFQHPTLGEYKTFSELFIIHHYNPKTISFHLSKILAEDYNDFEKDFRDLLYSYLDDLALKQLDGEQHWTFAYNLLMLQYETLNSDFQRQKPQLEQKKRAFCDRVETAIPLAKEHQFLEKIDFNTVLNLSTETLTRYLNGRKNTILQQIKADLDQKDAENFKKDLDQFIAAVTEFANGIFQFKQLSPFKYREVFITRVSKNFLVGEHNLFTGVNFLKEPDENRSCFSNNLKQRYKELYKATWIDEHTGAIIEGKKIELTQKLLVDYGYCTEDAFR